MSVIRSFMFLRLEYLNSPPAEKVKRTELHNLTHVSICSLHICVLILLRMAFCPADRNRFCWSRDTGHAAAAPLTVLSCRRHSATSCESRGRYEHTVSATQCLLTYFLSRSGHSLATWARRSVAVRAADCCEFSCMSWDVTYIDSCS